MATAIHGKQRARDWDAFSANYHAESVTPFAKGVRFRLRRDLRRLMRAWQTSAGDADRVFVDYGCGPGDALELVAGVAPIAVGVDFAPRMLRLAQRRLRNRGVEARVLNEPNSLRRVHNASRVHVMESRRPRTVLVRADLRNLRAIRGCVDAATSINSICASNGRDATKMFREMAGTLRSGGVFYSVWPALESLEYLFELDRRAGNPPEVRNEVLQPDGVHVDATGYALKLFAADEIRQLCERAGLRVETLEKVRYPWSYMRELGWGDHPRRPQLWDWYVIARAK